MINFLICSPNKSNDNNNNNTVPAVIGIKTLQRWRTQLEILTVELYPNGHYVNTKKGKWKDCSECATTAINSISECSRG